MYSTVQGRGIGGGVVRPVVVHVVVVRSRQTVNCTVHVVVMCIIPTQPNNNTRSRYPDPAQRSHTRSTQR